MKKEITIIHDTPEDFLGVNNELFTVFIDKSVEIGDIYIPKNSHPEFIYGFEVINKTMSYHTESDKTPKNHYKVQKIGRWLNNPKTYYPKIKFIKGCIFQKK